MEFLKNFMVGIATIIVGFAVAGMLILLIPFLAVAGSIAFFFIKIIIFIIFCAAFVAFIGYMIRKFIWPKL